MKDLKEKALRGGVARLSAQAADLLVRPLSLMALGRLLDPNDFGLVGMVTAFTGVLGLFRDFGLSAATIQCEVVTDAQTVTLFWINLGVGAALAALSLAFASPIAAFYHEPRLFAVTAVLGIGFLFNAAGIQHGVLLQRQMRFTALAVISTISLVVSAAIGICGAAAGLGYWALVAMSVAAPLFVTLGSWVTTGWVPGMPRKGAPVRSMMRFGGAVTFNSLLGYAASNVEKILVGRFWGANAIGLYGRAYQLVSIPTNNLNSAAGEVAFAVLSRIQSDPLRLKHYFMKGYSLILTITLPVSMVCAIFAPDIILVVLGPKWTQAVPIFRLLAPTIFISAIGNPLGWLLYSTGRVGRSIKMSLVSTPIMIASYFLALPYGPRGMALVYSAFMMVWIIPAATWAVRGTPISVWDIVRAVKWPLASSIAAGGLAFGFRLGYGHLLAAFPRLVLECAILFGAYLAVLLFASGQKSFYLDVLRGLKGRSALEGKSLVTV
jgi:PST family polysaccharide transporter